MEKDFDDILYLNLTEENINNMIDEVVAGIHEEWPTLYKIRYIYLEIGKRVYKDTDFFFSVDGKLGEANLSIETIKEIYNSKGGQDFKVICKSASWILKKAYERVGIKAQLVETNTTIAALSDEEEFLINHWFLAIYDGDTAYLATLTPDLPYIQLNMETKHFASDIPYKRNYNGKIMQVYKGEEIKHSTISRDKLKEIDKAIGYLSLSYPYNDKAQSSNDWFLQYDNASLYMLRDSLRDNRLYYEIEGQQTSFCQSLFEFEGEQHKKISLLEDDLSSLTHEDWNQWIKLISRQVLSKIEEILGYEVNVLPNLDSPYWNYEAWLLNLCVQIQDDILKQLDNNERANYRDFSIDVEHFKYNKWSRKLKKEFNCKEDSFNYYNILTILDKLTSLVSIVQTKNGNLRKILTSLTYHFIPPEHLYENNIDEQGYLSNYYIANKFDKLFPKIFGCNELVTDFNKMEYSEQAVIIKEILNLMFGEITYDNSSHLVDYDKNYNAILNRIQMYPIKNKENGEYSILFNILGDNKCGDYYFFYNPNSNVFKISNALDIYNEYIIISNRMKHRMSIDDLEKIELMDEKRPKR